MRTVRWVSMVGLLIGLAGAARTAEAGYTEGFIWDRSVDYDPGAIPFSPVGNPNTDAEGNGVWQMESTNAAGDGLGGASPWYEGATQLQVWDNSWYGGGGVWARGDNVNPYVNQGSLLHNINPASNWVHIPLVRWLNPIAQGYWIDITGSLTENWRGPGGQAANIDFEVVIAHLDAETGLYTVLFGDLFEKPTDDTSLESLTKAVSISGVYLTAGDQILISHRGLTSGSAWPSLNDNLEFELTEFIPEPATMTLLAFGGMGMLIRRRRRKPRERCHS